MWHTVHKNVEPLDATKARKINVNHLLVGCILSGIRRKRNKNSPQLRNIHIGTMRICEQNFWSLSIQRNEYFSMLWPIGESVDSLKIYHSSIYLALLDYISQLAHFTRAFFVFFVYLLNYYQVLFSTRPIFVVVIVRAFAIFFFSSAVKHTNGKKPVAHR